MLAECGADRGQIYVSDSSKQLCDDLIDEVKSYGAGGKACAVQADMCVARPSTRLRLLTCRQVADGIGRHCQARRR